MYDFSVMLILAAISMVAGCVLGFIGTREYYQNEIDELHTLNEYLERSIRSCERSCIHVNTER